MTPIRIPFLILLAALLALPAVSAVDYYLIPSYTSQILDPGGHRSQSFLVSSACCRTNDPTDAIVTIPLPPGSTNITAAATPGGWHCDVTGVTVTCRTFLAAIASNGPYPEIIVDFNAPSSTEGLNYTGTATITTTVADDNPANNFGYFYVSVYRVLGVTTADDFGAGSLRDSIARANEVCDGTIACKMAFAGPMKIEPRSPLPEITACSLLIDGGVASLASQDLERPVEISGTKAGFASGLELRSSCGVTLRGLTINGFEANGVVLAAPQLPHQLAGALAVESCFIGTDTKAMEARPNGLRGIATGTSFTMASVLNSTVSGNHYSGIVAWSANRVVVDGCRIGLGRDLRPLGNGASGVFIDSGQAEVKNSLIAYNHDFGVAVGEHASHVVTSMASVFANGVLDYDWGLDGPTSKDPAGRMPPAPVLIDASYDPASKTTVVRGVLPVGPRAAGVFDEFEVHLFKVTSQGYVELYPAANLESPTDDLPFTMSERGDLQGQGGDLRGQKIVAQTFYKQFYDGPPIDSSEMSAPMVVHP